MDETSLFYSWMKQICSVNISMHIGIRPWYRVFDLQMLKNGIYNSCIIANLIK